MTTTVHVNWNKEYDNETMWNEVCAWAIETFGLPGDRFVTHANINYMEFVFNCPKDALMMSLKWNAPIISKEELTVQFVGSLL